MEFSNSWVISAKVLTVLNIILLSLPYNYIFIASQFICSIFTITPAIYGASLIKFSEISILSATIFTGAIGSIKNYMHTPTPVQSKTLDQHPNVEDGVTEHNTRELLILEASTTKATNI